MRSTLAALHAPRTTAKNERCGPQVGARIGRATMADRASIFGAGVRTLVPELMDDPALERGEHERALRGLSRLNAASTD